MKKLDTARYYEVVELPRSNAWYVPLGQDRCIIGTIVQPKHEDGGIFTVKQASKNRRFDVGSRQYLGMTRYEISPRLRPLTQKEQEKINERTRQTT